MITRVSVFLTLVMSFCSVGHAEEMPKHVRDAMANLVGSWNTIIEYDGATLKGMWKVDHAADKSAVVVRATLDDGPSGISILGWDAANKIAVHQGFSGDGGCFCIKWTDVAEGAWKGDVTGVGEDGTESTSTCSVKFAKNEVVYREIRDGKPFVFTATR